MGEYITYDKNDCPKCSTELMIINVMWDPSEYAVATIFLECLKCRIEYFTMIVFEDIGFCIYGRDF